jgi:hypothetical protein
MQASLSLKNHDDFVARITEAAYGVLLRQGLQRSFIDVELELWQQIRNVFRTELRGYDNLFSARKVVDELPRELALVDVA